MWLAWDKNGSDDPEDWTTISPVTKENAMATQYVFTDTLEDGTEFGLMMTESEVTHEPHDNHLITVERAMEEYRKEHGP